MSWEQIAEQTAKKLLSDPTHDFAHTKRVLALAVQIGVMENADLEILTAAALLHDVGYSLDEENHEQKGAEIAQALLEMSNFPKDKIEKVVDCISSHRFSKNKKPTHSLSLEEKILQDADRLDAIGANGIARCFYWTGQRREGTDSALAHFEEKLLKLKDRMNTQTGKKLAEERHAYLLEFLKRLKE